MTARSIHVGRAFGHRWRQVNAGAFYGISWSTDSIARIEVSGPYAVIDDLRFAVIGESGGFTVAEPTSLALLTAGGALLIGFTRRSHRRGGGSPACF